MQFTMLKFLLDFFPLLAFFISYKLADIYVAVAVLMAATAIQTVGNRLHSGKWQKLHLFGLAIALVFGGLTLALQDDLFIKLKPTIVNLLFAGALFAGLFMGRPLLRYVFEAAFRLDDAGWRILTIRWAWFFVALAILNEIVWRNFSTDAWVSFKTFGIMPITIIFTLSQLPLINRHALPEEKKSE